MINKRMLQAKSLKVRRLSSALVRWMRHYAWFLLCVHAVFHPTQDQGVLQDVLAVVDRDLPLFNAVNLATAVSRMAKQQAAPDAIMHAAVQPAFTRLKTAISALRPCINPCSAPTVFVGLQPACPVPYMQHSGNDADE